MDLMPTSSGPEPRKPLAVTTRSTSRELAEPTPMKITPIALAAAMRRRAGMGLLLGIPLGVLIAAAIWYFLPPPVPVASSKLYMPAFQQGALFEHPDPPLLHNTQAMLIRSRLVMNAALRDPEVANLPIVKEQPDPALWLTRMINVDFPGGGEIIRISMSHEQVDQARKIVDAITTAYLDEIVNKAVKERKERLDRLALIGNRAQETLKRKNSVLEKLVKDIGSTVPENIAVQQRLAQEQMAAAESELVRLQSEIRRMQLEESMLKANPNASSPLANQAGLDAMVETSEPVQAALKRIAFLEAQIKETERVAKNHKDLPYYKEKLNELEQTRSSLQTLRTEVRDRIISDSKDRTQLGRNEKLAQLQQGIAFQRELEKVLTAEVDRRAQGITKINSANIHLEAERIEIRQTEDLYSKVNSRITTLTAEQDAPARILPLEQATIEPVDPFGRKIKFSAGGAIAGVFGTMFLLGLLELRHRRVDTTDSAAKDVGLMIVGTIPRPPSRMVRMANPNGSDRWSHALTVAMDSTRTMLIHGFGLSGTRVVVITSAEGGEGKTCLSSQLAASLGRAGHKTLLIDGDLRSPNIHSFFGIPVEPGMSEVLSGVVTSQDAIHETMTPNVWVMPAGELTEAAQQALVRGAMADIYTELKTQFEFIIVDTSPVLPVSDPIHFAQHADGVIVSMLQGKSRTARVRDACHKLRMVGANVLGAILNGTTPDTYGYGYGYGSKYVNSVPKA